MYEYLRGTIAESRPTTIVLEAAGVGYALIVPAGTRFTSGTEAVVHVHQVVREDSLTLYGFDSRAARDLFRQLLKVKQVGPSMAVAILSGMDREEFISCVRAKDAARLTKVKGVGKKTAEQILLDLSDRFGPQVEGQSTSGGDLPPLDDAVTALISIGFTEKEAKKAAERAAKEVGTDDLDVLLRAALRG